MLEAPHDGRPVPVLLMVRELGAGGTERQMTELARALDRSRFTPHVACFYARGFRADDLNASGIPVLELPLRSFLTPDLIRAGMKLRTYLRDHSIRLVHTFDYPSNIFGIPAARLCGTPHVLGSQRGYRTVYQRRHRLFLRAGDLLADGVVVNCEAMRRHLSQDYSVPERKIRLCYNGVDTGTFRPAPRQRPARLASASLVIGTVSVLRQEKGLPSLLDAFASVRQSCPGTRLVIVGSGPVARDLEARAAELGIGGSCLFEPATRNVVPWLHAIDIFVLPSLSEALSNSLLEAMACGCCAVASRVGGNPELVQDDETGLLFEKGNARDLAGRLRLLIQNPELRERLAERGSCHTAAKFSMAASVSRMQEIYDGFLEPLPLVAAQLRATIEPSRDRRERCL